MYGVDIFVVSEEKTSNNDNNQTKKNTIAINWNALDKWAPLAHLELWTPIILVFFSTKKIRWWNERKKRSYGHLIICHSRNNYQLYTHRSDDIAIVSLFSSKFSISDNCFFSAIHLFRSKNAVFLEELMRNVTAVNS